MPNATPSVNKEAARKLIKGSRAHPEAHGGREHEPRR